MMKKTDFLTLLRDGAKKYRYILIVIAAGLLLLLLPTGGEDDTPLAEPSHDVFSLDEFEQSLADALEQISGVGKTEVVLTLDSGTETIYQTDSREERDETSSSLESETVFESAGSGVQTAVVRGRLYPCFRGALVVCDGAGSASIRLEVTRAVEALTGLPSDRITVLKRGSD